MYRSESRAGKSTADECRQYGVTALGRKLDVTNAQHREDVVAEAVKELGHRTFLSTMLAVGPKPFDMPLSDLNGIPIKRLLCLSSLSAMPTAYEECRVARLSTLARWLTKQESAHVFVWIFEGCG